MNDDDLLDHYRVFTNINRTLTRKRDGLGGTMVVMVVIWCENIIVRRNSSKNDKGKSKEKMMSGEVIKFRRIFILVR